MQAQVEDAVGHIVLVETVKHSLGEDASVRGLLKVVVSDKHLAHLPELRDAIDQRGAVALGRDIGIHDAAQLGLFDLDMDGLEPVLLGRVGGLHIILAADIGRGDDSEVAARGQNLLGDFATGDGVDDTATCAEAVEILAVDLGFGERS